MAERSEVQVKVDNGPEFFLAFGLAVAGAMVAVAPLVAMQASGIWVSLGSFLLSAFIGMIGGALAAGVIGLYYTLFRHPQSLIKL